MNRKSAYRLTHLALATLFALTAGCALLTPEVNTELSTLRKGQYRIDQAHAALLFKVGHMGLSTTVGRFKTLDATLDFDPADLAATRLDATVQTGSVDLNNTALEDTLRGGDWFNTTRYPEAMFKTVSVEVLSDNTFLFTGDLTLLGVTAPLTLKARFNGGATNLLTGRYTLGFSATGTMRRSDFGMDKYPGMVGDEVELEVYAEFQRR